MDDPVIFKDPLRIQAQLISFFKGTITFPLPLDSLKAENISSITIFMELCSECPDYNNSWKSNITFWLNDEEVATYLSLGDYGDRRGILTPSWWPDNSTQYGLPVALKIDKSGSYLNGQKVSEVSLKDVHLEKSTIARFRLGVKDNAKYVGGVNIFGRCFGDINDDIKVQISYFSESAKPNQ
jgi:predicted transcriptional regulator